MLKTLKSSLCHNKNCNSDLSELMDATETQNIIPTLTFDTAETNLMSFFSRTLCSLKWTSRKCEYSKGVLF
jgi:hypothetical protein